jgi:hypothetical protein
MSNHPLADSYRLSISPRTEDEYRRFYDKLNAGLHRKGEISLETWQPSSAFRIVLAPVTSTKFGHHEQTSDVLKM